MEYVFLNKDEILASYLHETKYEKYINKRDTVLKAKHVAANVTLCKKVLNWEMHKLVSPYAGVLKSGMYFWRKGDTIIIPADGVNQAISAQCDVSKMKTVLLDKDEARLFTLVAFWIVFPKIPQFIETELVRCKIPDEYKVIKTKYLYRAITIRDSVKRIREGKSIKLKPRKATSWTSSISATSEFVMSRSGYSLVLRLPAADVKDKVMLNINSLPITKKNLSQIKDQKEIILKGNGIGGNTLKSSQVFYIQGKKNPHFEG